jgi:hypothetical protein
MPPTCFCAIQIKLSVLPAALLPPACLRTLLLSACLCAASMRVACTCCNPASLLPAVLPSRLAVLPVCSCSATLLHCHPADLLPALLPCPFAALLPRCQSFACPAAFISVIYLPACLPAACLPPHCGSFTYFACLLWSTVWCDSTPQGGCYVPQDKHSSGTIAFGA